MPFILVDQPGVRFYANFLLYQLLNPMAFLATFLGAKVLLSQLDIFGSPLSRAK